MKLSFGSSVLSIKRKQTKLFLISSSAVSCAVIGNHFDFLMCTAVKTYIFLTTVNDVLSSQAK